MRIELSYGRTHLAAELPDERVVAVLEPAVADGGEPDQEALVAAALASPVKGPRLSELVQGKDNVVLIASDHTRPVPTRVMFPQMLAEIRSGNPNAQLTVLVATGCHRATTRAELAEKIGKEYLDRDDIRFVVHDSHDESQLVDLGTLPSGGKLRVNRTAVEADLLIAEGFIEPHFFAGFSGGRKSVLPGICSAETVVANHCAAFIDSPRARTGVLEDNPIHRDMLWAAQTAGLAFVLNVAIDAQKRVIGAWAGEPDAAHRAGCAFVDARAGVDAAPADIVITTNGGHPLDQNIYQAVKGMTAAEATCKPGGVIIICAAAGDGHGGQSFYDTFAGGEPLESILARFRATPAEQTIPDQWQSQIFIRVLQQFHVVMVTEAPREMVEALRMHKAESLEEALALADGLLGRSDGSITVVPDGVSVIVRQ